MCLLTLGQKERAFANFLAWAIALDWAGPDGVTWQWSSPNREHFPFLFPGKESLSRLPTSGSQGHEGRDAAARSVLQKQRIWREML